MSSNSERNEAIEMLLQAAQLDAEAEGGDILAAARAILDQARAAKAERDMSPTARGIRAARNRCNDVSWMEQASEAELSEYHEAYCNEEEVIEDERCDRIERDYLDGECTLSGVYFAR